MPRKSLFILFFVLSLSSLVSAQKHFSIRAKMTYDYFSAEDLKTTQSQIVEYFWKYNIPAKALQSFPPHYGLQVQFLIPVNDSLGVNAGVYFEQMSTGGRVHYKDYSGEEKFDQVLQAQAFGVMGEKNFRLNRFFSFNLNFGLSLISVSYNIKTYEQIYNYSKSDEIGVSNFTLGASPGVGLSFQLYNFYISGNAGFQFCLPSGFQYNGQTLKNSVNGDAIKPGLDGFRLAAGLGFYL
ncbi:MAG: hypothetical protein ACM3U0_01750 [archaeon]